MTKALAKNQRSAIKAMYIGVALTVVAVIVPYVDHVTANELAGYIRDGYPTYSQARIDTGVTTYVVYLSVLAALGTISWISTIRALKNRSGGLERRRQRCSFSERVSPCSTCSSKTPRGKPASRRCWDGSGCFHAWRGSSQ